MARSDPNIEQIWVALTQAREGAQKLRLTTLEHLLDQAVLELSAATKRPSKGHGKAL